MGIRFAKANGSRTLELFAIARLACIPFSLIGAIVCYLWADQLWKWPCGMIALALWIFNPMVIGNASLVMPDVPATATGALACYLFWRWTATLTWHRCLITGLSLGIALLCKFTHLILFPLFSLLLIVAVVGGERPRGKNYSVLRALLQFAIICLIAVYEINLGYGFVGTGNQLRTYEFQSRLLAGDAEATPHNRFADSVLGFLPVPIPADYLLGIDCQKSDFEGGMRSYFAGRWQETGWWYYYLLGLLIKTPIGTLLSVALTIYGTFTRKLATNWVSELYMLLPFCAIIILISSQTGMSVHLRYVLPALPFLLVWCGKIGNVVSRSPLAYCGWLAVLMTIGESVLIWPHSLAFFNCAVGGPKNGHRYMLESNIACGQDALFLRDWVKQHPQVRPIYLAYFGLIDPSIAGIEFRVAPLGPKNPLTTSERSRLQPVNDLVTIGPLPGWHVIDVNFLEGTSYGVASGNWRWREHFGTGLSYEYYKRLIPVGRIAYSYWVYYIDPEKCNSLRNDLKLPPIPTLDGEARPSRFQYQHR